MLGIPLGTVIGQLLGWRATFWSVAGGIAITAGYGYAAPSWLALLLIVGSILLAVAGWWKDSCS